MAGEYDNRMSSFDGQVTLETADGTQTVFDILLAAGYTGHPIARHFILKHSGGDDVRVGSGVDVDAGTGNVFSGGDIIERWSFDLRSFRIYVPSDTALSFVVYSS